MEFLEQVFLGNPLREWGIALLWAIGGVVVGKLLYRWFSRRLRRNIGERWWRLFEPPWADVLTSIAEA